MLERVRTDTEVTHAQWDEQRAKWRLQTTAGPFEADILVAACGQLSIPKKAAIKGLESFPGPVFHTAEWDHDVDLTGKRVAVVGTGCSAIQTVPAIQPLAAQIDVYQRSPGWTFPKMDFEYSERAKRLFERFPALQRAGPAGDVRVHGHRRRGDDEPTVAPGSIPRRRPPSDREGDKGQRSEGQGDADRRDRL